VSAILLLDGVMIIISYMLSTKAAISLSLSNTSVKLLRPQESGSPIEAHLKQIYC